MNLFDFVVDELLEALRKSIYRYAKRVAPGRKARRRGLMGLKPDKLIRRRRSFPWGGLLMWVGILAVGIYLWQRLTSQRE